MKISGSYKLALLFNRSAILFGIAASVTCSPYADFTIR
jgi:hypothetical protein